MTHDPASTPADAPAGRRLRAIAFGSGGFDTAMQLGVVHALLVARGVAPDFVAGLSAGAVHAAALAEILQAGEGRGEEERRNAQVDSFRKFLASFLELPGDLLRSIVPDTYEINADRPLAPIELPIHFAAERAGRVGADHARTGLVRLMNRLLDLRLPVRALAMIVNRALRLNATGEEPPSPWRTRKRLGELAFLWLLGHRYMFALAPTAWALFRAARTGRPPAERRAAGGTAAQLIGLPIVRRAGRALSHLGSFALLELLWLLLPLLALLAAPFRRRLGGSRRGGGRRMLDRVLEHYGIADGLANTYALQQQLVRCFDPGYFGETNMAEVLDKALDRSNEPARGARSTKTLDWYATHQPQITVAPIAARVDTGDLAILPRDVPVVDALLAATAVVPIFPAFKVESAAAGYPLYFIDGRNVSAEPVGALMELLRQDGRLDQATGVDIYPVSSLAAVAGGDGEACAGILEVAARAMELQRLRDATIEQRLTALQTKALPPGGARIDLGGRRFVRAEVRPLALERPIEINRRIFMGHGDVDAEELVYEAVADGCRAALQAMIPDAIAAVGGSAGAAAVSCRETVARRLAGFAGRSRDGDVFLPGHGAEGPGLEEVCRRCALSRPSQGEPAAAERQRLKVGASHCDWPPWPVEGAAETGTRAPVSTSDPLEPVEIAGWPEDRDGERGAERPLVSLLFGGGVFRGVFHMGVMNALDEIGLQPDLVAGSSVGSIIAAMIAQAFRQTHGRPEQIANLAASFLAIDRLVMTDRLADFVRGLTLRAADAPFSLRDLDLVLRRYDLDRPGDWSARARRVVGGLERLFYLSPIRLSELVKAAREREAARFAGLLSKAVQEFLDRSGVGQEVLGTEPLALLIREEVIRPLGRGARDTVFDAFHPALQFLATATNLSRGTLEVLGSSTAPQEVSLLYGLLASSAFPGVFRPRRSWEIFPNADDMDQYIDGGTIDNLPLDAVARFLDRASRSRLLTRRPRDRQGREIPHLLFTASLEVDPACLKEDDVEDVRRSFLRLAGRARTFSYNRKIDEYRAAQRNLRDIQRGRASGAGRGAPWEPLDLHVIAVRPRWLCSTFGFHPMIGFRRQRQAESIAHGCASTIGTLYAERQGEQAAWLDAWGAARLDAVDARAVVLQGDGAAPILYPQREGKGPDECWFRRGARCPFSPGELEKRHGIETRGPLVRELARIYEACGRTATHRAAHEVESLAAAPAPAPPAVPSG